jgi:hypothetical protein
MSEVELTTPTIELLDDVKFAKLEAAAALEELVAARAKFSKVQQDLQKRLASARDKYPDLAKAAGQYVSDQRLFSNSSEATFAPACDELVKELAALIYQ